MEVVDYLNHRFFMEVAKALRRGCLLPVSSGKPLDVADWTLWGRCRLPKCPFGRLLEMVGDLNSRSFKEVAGTPRRGCQSPMCHFGMPLDMEDYLNRKSVVEVAWPLWRILRSPNCPSRKLLDMVDHHQVEGSRN